MASRISVNEGVNITAWYFRNNRQMVSYPRRIEWGGKSISFSDGLQLCVSKAGAQTKIFDMQDASGSKNYRLQCSGANPTGWTLVAITDHT